MLRLDRTRRMATKALIRLRAATGLALLVLFNGVVRGSGRQR